MFIIFAPVLKVKVVQLLAYLLVVVEGIKAVLVQLLAHLVVVEGVVVRVQLLVAHLKQQHQLLKILS